MQIGDWTDAHMENVPAMEHGIDMKMLIELLESKERQVDDLFSEIEMLQYAIGQMENVEDEKTCMCLRLSGGNIERLSDHDMEIVCR